MKDFHIMTLIFFGVLTILVIAYIYNCNDEHFTRTNRSKSHSFIIGRSRCNCNNSRLENFSSYDDGEYYDYYDIANYPTQTWPAQNYQIDNLPWWNSTRHTRNMSWDIRGDVPITSYYVGPWHNSPLI